MRRALSPVWLRQPERSTSWAVRMMIWLALRMGRRFARALLYPICWYFLVFSVRSRVASRRYLARVLRRPPTLGDLFRHYHTFAATILDRVFLLAGRTAEFRVTIYGEAMVRALRARQQGCVLLGAHFGSFEVLRAVGAQQPALAVHYLMYEDNSRKINDALRDINPSIAAWLIPLGRPDTMLRVRDRVREGAWVGCLADRCISGDKVVVHPFLGRDAAFPVGPFRLAAALGCPVLTMFGVYRGDRSYEVHFELLGEANDDTGDAPLEQWIQRYVARLEQHCRETPYNWFNFYDFWHI